MKMNLLMDTETQGNSELAYLFVTLRATGSSVRYILQVLSILEVLEDSRSKQLRCALALIF